MPEIFEEKLVLTLNREELDKLNTILEYVSADYGLSHAERNFATDLSDLIMAYKGGVKK